MKSLGMDIHTSLEIHLLQLGKIKLQNNIRVNNCVNMAKGKNNEYAKIRTQLENIFKYIAKNMEYGSQIVCKVGVGKPTKKKDGGDTKKRKKTNVKLCKHRVYSYMICDVEKKKIPFDQS